MNATHIKSGQAVEFYIFLSVYQNIGADRFLLLPYPCTLLTGVNVNTLHTWISKYSKPVKDTKKRNDVHIYDEVKRLKKELGEWDGFIVPEGKALLL